MATSDSSESGDAPEAGGTSDPMSLDQFIAFNDELAALVRAGLPMERTLRELARDHSGTLRDTLKNLAERLGRGESLATAVAAEGGRLPSFYRAVVEAGLRAGRLPVALEGIANYARNYADLRQTVGLAMAYPLVVLLVAYGFFVLFVVELAPRFLTVFRSFRLPAQPMIDWLIELRGTVLLWGPMLPVLVLALGLWWVRTGPRTWTQPAWVRKSLARMPWVRGILTNTRMASFADLLSVLLDNEVPLHQAVVLAADATGDQRMVRGACEMAQAVERGETAAASVNNNTAFPPLLRWLFVAGLERGAWVQALRHASQTYRELAQHRASLLRQVLPVILLLAIGATAVLVYVLTVFVPFSSLLEDLSV